MSSRCLLALVLCSLLATSADAGVTKVEGEYQIQLDIRKQDRFFAWDFDSNNNDTFGLAQFRIFTQPTPETEAFLKFEADWVAGNNDGRRQVFQYREGHLRFRKELPRGFGIDSYLFSRQDRFWVDNHLINVVQGGDANDFGNAQGMRIDHWGRFGNFTYIQSDFSSQSNPNTGSQPMAPVPTDDGHIARWRSEVLDKQLRLGLTWNRKVEGQATEPRQHTSVVAGDMRYRWGTTDFSLEFAQSQMDNVEPGVNDGRFRWDELSFSGFDDFLPEDSVLRAEIRTLRFGSGRYGFYNIAPSAWILGPRYANQLGDANRDERGFAINSWYLIPRRAITLTLNYLTFKKEVDDQRRVTEFYGEMYTEYVNGFTSKFFYRNRRTRDTSVPGEPEIIDNVDVFAEMQVESRLAWTRLQAKIKDIDTIFQKELMSLETAVNLTPTLKIYNRFTLGNDPTRLRKGIFSELQYRPLSNMELFLSYGPFWIGDSNNPVEDGDLAGSQDNKDLVRFIMKGQF